MNEVKRSVPNITNKQDKSMNNIRLRQGAGQRSIILGILIYQVCPLHACLPCFRFSHYTVHIYCTSSTANFVYRKKKHLSHNNSCFRCNIAITNFLVSHTCDIRFHDVIGQSTVHNILHSYAKIRKHD